MEKTPGLHALKPAMETPGLLHALRRWRRHLISSIGTWTMEKMSHDLLHWHSTMEKMPDHLLHDGRGLPLPDPNHTQILHPTPPRKDGQSPTAEGVIAAPTPHLTRASEGASQRARKRERRAATHAGASGHAPLQRPRASRAEARTAHASGRLHPSLRAAAARACRPRRARRVPAAAAARAAQQRAADSGAWRLSARGPARNGRAAFLWAPPFRGDAAAARRRLRRATRARGGRVARRGGAPVGGGWGKPLPSWRR
jgi:hypothetical protein